MPFVNFEVCREDPDNTPNVSMIRVEGVRIIRGKIPREIRRELFAGVSAGKLGHLKKDGFKPEAFFHPNSESKAKGLRNREAIEGITALSKVVVRASDLPTHDQDELVARYSERNQSRISP